MDMKRVSSDSRMTVEATVGDGSEGKRVINLILTDKKLGSGLCGAVMAAEVFETGEKVAVKTMDMAIHRTCEDVKYMKMLKHCNIINMLYHFRILQPSPLQYVVMERMDMSLISLYGSPIDMSQMEIKLYVYQIIRGVAYMHKRGICHRDIKPHNVLVNRTTCVVKLCDFGLSYDLPSKRRPSPSKGSPQYMAPELLLGFSNYSTSVDVWGIGCIFLELLRGHVRLFTRAKTAMGQLAIMMKLFGTPSEDQFVGMKPHFPFHQLKPEKAKQFSEIIKPFKVSDATTSLCSGLLCYSPSSRLLPHEALAHKFFDELRSPKTTRLANGNPLPPLFNFQPGEFPGDFNHLIPNHERTSEEVTTIAF